MLIVLLYVLAANYALGGLMLITSVNKPRKPLTPGWAAYTVAITALLVFALVSSAVQLS